MNAASADAHTFGRVNGDAAPILATREGGSLRLAFTYHADLVDAVKGLPFATFDQSSKTWTAAVCTQTFDALRRMHYDGLVSPYPDDLLAEGETLEPCAKAVLRPGTARRPYIVVIAMRDDAVYSQLKAIPGAQWEKRARGLSYPAAATAALADLADRGILDDADDMLRPADVTVIFDARTGRFVVRGDRRAQPMFDHHFPGRDVVAAWRGKGHDVAFADELTEEVYRGELARRHDQIQPDGMRLPLYDYQQRDVAIAVERSGFALLHQPGVGKTPSALGLMMETFNRQLVQRAVVVVPAALRSQWAAETVRFCRLPHSDLVVVDGTKAKRHDAYAAAQHAKVVIVHYDVLRRDSDLIRPLVDGQLLILDEAHRIKGYTSQRSKMARELGRVAAKRLALTGTPVENNPGEWFQLIGNFVAPGTLGAPQDFLEKYMFKGRFGGYEGARNLRELRDRTRVHFQRFMKSQVAEHLPPLRVQNVVLDVDQAYQKVLRTAHRDARDEIAKQRVGALTDRSGPLLPSDELDDAKSGAEMTSVGMLRALCSSPRLLETSDSVAAETLRKAGIVPPDVDGPKLDELRQVARDLHAHAQRRRAASGTDRVPTAADVMGERMVVFSYSRRMADLIAERLDEDGVKCVTYTGATSRKDRDAAVAAFTDPASDVTVFVATDAASEGLNLGRCCNLLINFDVPWNPSTLIQRGNRIHRVDGTAEHYLVMNFTLSGTLEAGILKLLERKVSLSDTILGEHGGAASTVGKRTSLSALLADAFEELDGRPLPELNAVDVAEMDRAAAAGPAEPEPAESGSDDRSRLWQQPVMDSLL